MSLKRRLSLFDAALLIVGNVIGVGIFTTNGFLAGELSRTFSPPRRPVPGKAAGHRPDSRFFPGQHPRHPTDTPHKSIISQSAIAAVMVLFGTFNELLGCVVFVMILTSIATGLCLYILRW
jgi:hypothetical protein